MRNQTPLYTALIRRNFIAAFAIFFMAACSQSGFNLRAQAPHPLADADRQKIDSIIHRMTLEEKLAYIGGTGFAIRAVPRVGLPVLQMSDGPVGVRSNAGFPSTTYAAGIGLAATWDRDLAVQIGAGIGRDARARGIHFMLGPGTDIYRSPRNGRNFEYFGEDPFLASEMVVGYITGMQRQGVSATVKHFLANDSEFLRHDSDSVIDERTLREIDLPPFEAAVKRAHVGAIMDSYNLINGVHATQNGYFNIEIARKEWGFAGTMMSDWNATYDAVAAAKNGLDLEMPTGKFMNSANLLPAIKSGKVSEATIDEKVRHILTTAAMFGWLDRDQRNPAISTFDAESNATALRSARESVVLLKNERNVLPLNRRALKTVLVVGPDAYPGSPVGGGSAGVVPFHTVSLLEGVSNMATGVTVLYDAGLPTLTELAEQTDFLTAADGPELGLIEETFDNRDLTGKSRQSVTPHLNNGGINLRALPENLRQMLSLSRYSGRRQTSRRYTGYYTATASTTYLVALAGEGEGNGNRVTIDGKVVIDDWTLARAMEPHVSIPLSAGMHKVVVEDWSNGIYAGRLRFAIVPENKLVQETAKQMAAKADAVIVAAGFGSNTDNESEGEGGDRTFDLPYGQDELIRAMAALNPKTIVAVTSGGNVDSTSWLDKVPALLEAWYGGQSGGTALAEILFGNINPSGHLPATFERRAEDNPAFKNYYSDENNRIFYKEGIFIGYRGYEKNGVAPLFPFGYGLSYTSFRLTNLRVVHGSGSSVATVDFDVTNTGRRAGAEVAQIYISDTHAPVPRPLHELKGFQRVELAAGAKKHVSIPLDARAFAYYDVNAKRWTIAPGTFAISVGDSVASLPLSAPLRISPQEAQSASF